MSRHKPKGRGPGGPRSRKPSGARPATQHAAARPASSRPAADRPRAPWHPVPLVELAVLVGILLLVAGVITGLSTDRGRLLLVCGMVLGSLGGLDTALREHFGGFRSHTTVLAALPAVLVAGVLFFSRAPWLAVVLATAAVFAGGAFALRRAFRRG